MNKKAIIQALRDTTQSASNSIASNLSAPVDAATWALNKAGLNIQNPVGGSEWMAQKGLTAPVEDGIPKVIGETVGGLAPILGITKAPQIASGMNQMVDNAMAPAALNKQQGVVKLPFEIDKTRFESAKDYLENISMPEMEQVRSFARKMLREERVPKSFPGYDYELRKAITKLVEEKFK